MTASQRAMATAVIYPEPAKGGRGKRSGHAERLGVSKGHAADLMSMARAVLGTEFVTPILEGNRSLNEAL